MEPIDQDTLRETRAILASDLPHRCDIQRNTGALVDGAQRNAWTSAGSLTACKISPLGGDTALRGDQNRPQATWAVRFPSGTAVTEANRLIVTGSDSITGETFSRVLIPVSVTAPARADEVARIARCRDATAAERVG